MNCALASGPIPPSTPSIGSESPLVPVIAVSPMLASLAHFRQRASALVGRRRRVAQARSGFEIQGHRGARGLFPENTLEGFARTLALGVRVIELDVGVTADGVAVVFHDVALNGDIARGRGGEWGVRGETLIRALRLADLAQFD